LDGPEREVRLLVEHREDLVAERTRVQQRLRWHLHELEPGWEIPVGGVDPDSVLDDVQARLAAHAGVVA
jgi:transposase